MKFSDNKIKDIVKNIQNEKLVKKYIKQTYWVSGTSTYVYPIQVLKDRIVLQWNSDKKLFDKFITRFVEKHRNLLNSGYFWKSDGSCPSTITFYLKETVDDDSVYCLNYMNV